MGSESEELPTGACFPLGFEGAGVAAGIKGGDALDVSVLFTSEPAHAAGVFTTNIVRAAPIRVSMKHLLSPSSKVVVISSGNANAATGNQGIQVAEQMCQAAAEIFHCSREEVLIAQTGLIGVPLDAEIVTAGVTKAARAVTPDGGLDAARAIMTTDTVPKIASTSIELNGREVRVGGMAKGAAMLSPSMATMLAVITTDASVHRDVLRVLLEQSLPDSFHSIVVDGCRSTNDTVFLLANGMSGAPEIASVEDPAFPALQQAISEVSQQLAQQMVRDAEGATKFLTFTLRGAASESEARQAALAVVNSVLVKCSLAGKDAYWGRVISELGASGATFDPDLVQIYYGGELVCKNGIAIEFDRAKVESHMTGSDILIEADLKNGNFSATAYGCDLTHAYVDENMGTS